MDILRSHTSLLASDGKGTPLAVQGREAQRIAWSAHGFQGRSTGVMRTGFNGEFRERRGVYLLGSYRAYNPVLMCLHSPDSLSPFGPGGLNAYAYCLGDPVNRVDPTGHLPWWASLGAGLAATVLTAGFAGPALAATGISVSATVAGQVAAVATTVSIASGIGGGLANGTLKTTLNWTAFAAGLVAGVSAGLAARQILPRTVFRRASASRTVQAPVQADDLPTIGGTSSRSSLSSTSSWDRNYRIADETGMGLIEHPQSLMDYGRNRELWIDRLAYGAPLEEFSAIARGVVIAHGKFRVSLIKAMNGQTPYGDLSEVARAMRMSQFSAAT